MKSYNLLLGTSGTGKGTRVSQLMSFLVDRYNVEQIFTMWNGKEKPFGYYFPEIDVFVVGKIVTSHKSGLVSFTSLDTINSMTGKTILTGELIKEQTYGHVIGEGEALLISHRYRPLYMAEYYGIKDMSFHIFSYPNRIPYDERIMARSGKLAGEGGWNRNKSYLKLYNQVDKEIIELGSSYNIEAYDLNYDADITVFGRHLLMKIGLGKLLQSFSEYSKEYDTKRSL